VDEEAIVLIDLINSGPLDPNPIKKKVATACKLKTSLGPSIRKTQSQATFRLAFERNCSQSETSGWF
jgi:hypothetical protein